MPEFNQNDTYVRIQNDQNDGIPCPFCGSLQSHYIPCPLINGGLSTLEIEAIKTTPYRTRLEQAIKTNACFHPINDCPPLKLTEEDEGWLTAQHILIPKN